MSILVCWLTGLSPLWGGQAASFRDCSRICCRAARSAYGQICIQRFSPPTSLDIHAGNRRERDALRQRFFPGLEHFRHRARLHTCRCASHRCCPASCHHPWADEKAGWDPDLRLHAEEEILRLWEASPVSAAACVARRSDAGDFRIPRRESLDSVALSPCARRPTGERL